METVAEVVRTRADIAVAQRLGKVFGQRLRNWPGNDGPLFYRLLSRRSGSYEESRRLFQDLLRGLEAADRTPGLDRASWRTFSFSEPALELHAELDSALRLVALARSLPGGGVPVLNETDEVYGCAPLFDLLNPRARRGVIDLDGESRESRDVDRGGYLYEWLSRPSRPDDRVRWVDQRTAMTGFITLFADNLRTVVQFFTGPGSGYVEFKVTARYDDWQVESYTEYNYSPTVFGGKLTTPVSDRLRSGYYKFQGRQDGRLVKDPGTYIASPWHREASLTAF